MTEVDYSWTSPELRPVLLRAMGFDGLAAWAKSAAAAAPAGVDPRGLQVLVSEAVWQADEARRIQQGEPPRLSAQAAPYALPAALGDAIAARRLVECSPDFQRGAWAHWLCSIDAGQEAARAALEIALTQDNFFRQIPDLWGCLRYAAFPIPERFPERLTIYHGEGDDSVSWTTCRAVAEHFAELFGGRIDCRVVDRAAIAFYSDIRGEKEVICWPT
ncbi:hypothetical protein T8T21_14135 [Limimaricola variabilis]|uniref:hypothetical protein n=1 Tax=Limimaricola variabilis TaxID=1492771 RepID=UPI002AC9B3C6|nr:hypothetical protein [Limimaricola variabilis]WPY94230.1 hypothetical protein T8T21_14135 [Limimaricola variabilis]